MTACLTFFHDKPNNKVMCKPYNKMNQGQQCSYSFILWANIQSCIYLHIEQTTPCYQKYSDAVLRALRSISSQWNKSLSGAILFVQSAYSHAFDVITSFKE